MSCELAIFISEFLICIKAAKLNPIMHKNVSMAKTIHRLTNDLLIIFWKRLRSFFEKSFIEVVCFIINAKILKIFHFIKNSGKYLFLQLTIINQLTINNIKESTRLPSSPPAAGRQGVNSQWNEVTSRSIGTYKLSNF